MPLFDVQCPSCFNVKETIINNCPDNFKINEYCFNCNQLIDLDILPPLTAMQPDNMWFGKQTNLGYFNSKKEYKDYIKNNNLERATRDNYESAQKNQSKRFETVAQKNKENLNKFIEKEIVHTIDLPEGT
jgi:hypothetical protein